MYRSVPRSTVQLSEPMRALRPFAPALLCALGLTHAERACAQSAAPIELRWNALEGCPRADTVLARARKIAGASRPTLNTLQADASITQASEGSFRLRLEIHYGNLAAVRNIEGKSCKDLAGAAAVALALLLSSEEPLSERELADDLAGTSPSSTAAGTTSQNPAQDEQHAAPSTKATTSSDQRAANTIPSSGAEFEPPRRWHLLVVAPLGSLGAGPMKQVSRGLGADAGLAYDRWRFSVEGKLWASQHETVSHGEGDGVELKRWSVAARACRVLFGVRFEFAPCALTSLHHLSMLGSGPNFVSSGTRTVSWAGLGIGTRARWSLAPWLGIVANADGELQLSRPEVGVSSPPESRLPATELVERLAPVAATLSVGVEWIL